MIWRMISSEPLPAAENMATDEALLLHACETRSLPILRLYQWRPAAISIGYFQNIAEMDVTQWGGDDCSLVRRMTGGGAIAHGADLTYSIVGRCDGKVLPRRNEECYRLVHNAIVSTLVAMGLPAGLRGRADKLPRASSPLCSATMSEFDVMIDGRKVAGSAQRRRRGVILQQGSIALFPQVIDPQMWSVSEALGGDVEATQIRTLFARALFDAIGAEHTISDLNNEEKALAQELSGTKYSVEDWNSRRLDPMRRIARLQKSS